MLQNKWLTPILGVLLLSLPASAQSCPITVEKINPRTPIGLGAEDPWGYFLYVRYTNNSPKAVEAVRFSVAFADIINSGQRSAWDYTDERRVKPGGHKDATWGDGVYTHDLGKQVKATVHLLRVVFSDGSKWEDAPDAPESHCTWTN